LGELKEIGREEGNKLVNKICKEEMKKRFGRIKGNCREGNKFAEKFSHDERCKWWIENQSFGDILRLHPEF
jgi:hypothetical protein